MTFALTRTRISEWVVFQSLSPSSLFLSALVVTHIFSFSSRILLEWKINMSVGVHPLSSVICFGKNQERTTRADKNYKRGTLVCTSTAMMMLMMHRKEYFLLYSHYIGWRKKIGLLTSALVQLVVSHFLSFFQGKVSNERQQTRERRNEHKRDKICTSRQVPFFCASLHAGTYATGASTQPVSWLFSLLSFRPHPQAQLTPCCSPCLDILCLVPFSPFLLYFSFCHMELYEWQG